MTLLQDSSHENIEKTSSGIIKFHEKLIKQLTPEEITSALVSFVGLSNLAHEFIWECVRGFIELPIIFKYSLFNTTLLLVFYIAFKKKTIAE